jgi:DNA (cytosine-5)-methyltransferase 1
MWWTKSRRAQNVDDYETWISGGVVPTLNVFDNASETRATVLIIDGTRVNDVRVYEDGIVPTVVARYGTGGGNVPMVFSHTQGLDVQASEENSPTLRAGGSGMAVVFEPGSLTRNAGSKPNENVAPTLRANMGDNQPAVVYPIQNTVIGRADENGPSGKGYKDDGEPMFTMDTTSPHAVALAFDLYNQQVTEKNQTLSAAASDASHTGTIWKDQTVRRLTPIECERLQGFPDDWTSGQADSNRYKQMGNAVAVPVVEWIVGRMVAQLND